MNNNSMTWYSPGFALSVPQLSLSEKESVFFLVYYFIFTSNLVQIMVLVPVVHRTNSVLPFHSFSHIISYSWTISETSVRNLPGPYTTRKCGLTHTTRKKYFMACMDIFNFCIFSLLGWGRMPPPRVTRSWQICHTI